jgi:glycosyltransferase involved in cell wall biosynthesis
MTLIEAASVGIPVIASNVGGVPEVVTDSDTAILVSPDDPGALKRAVRSMTRDYARFHANCLKRAPSTADRFSAERWVKRAVSEYRRASERAHRGGVANRPSPAETRKTWVAWEVQRRSTTLSKELGAELFQFSDRRRLRYPRVIAKTLFTLLAKRPDVLFVQNPSTVLAFLASVAKPFFGYRLVVDRHTLSNMSKMSIIRFFDRFSLDHADLTIVTNDDLRRALLGDNESRNICVLPDRIPFLAEVEPVKLPARHNVLFVCAWADDEPVSNVIGAATLLPDDIVIHISGKPKAVAADVPANVRLTGFLSQREYDALLRSVDVVLDLTTAENCLVCGAYEAVAAGKPLITSNTKILREYFDTGVLHISHEPATIANAIRQAIDEHATLSNDIRALRRKRDEEWRSLFRRHVARNGL